MGLLGWLRVLEYFYPRSPCGERRCEMISIERCSFISIHALLAESDQANAVDQILPGHISIHALLAESDESRPLSEHPTTNFYPRSPCGERLSTCKLCNLLLTFLSTLSLRRATAKVHKTVGHFCAYETNFMEIASSC